MHKKWSFEGYMASSGRITLFVLDGSKVEALIGRWEADEQHQFFRNIERLMADEDDWRNWQYVDADMLATNRTWQMVSSGTGISSEETLQEYYEGCKTSEELFFRSNPDGGALHGRDWEKYPVRPGCGLGRGRNKNDWCADDRHQR